MLRSTTLTLVTAVTAVGVGCKSDRPVSPCTGATDCDLTPGGQCLPSPLGLDLCAYPDTVCGSGLSWGEFGGDLSGECVVPEVDASPPDANAQIDAAVMVPAGMVDVPAGAFSMGCNVPAGCGTAADALPHHQVTLRRFAIDRLEASRADYAACLTAGVCTEPPLGGADSESNLPVQTTWQGASTFCAWKGKRLPTEAEWEKAARSYDDRYYPWGNLGPTCELARFSACTPNMLDPVESHPSGASPYGALNMSGNQWEWTADWYADTYYQSSPTTDPQGPASGTQRVVRGGDYLDGASGGSPHLMSWYRRKFDVTSNAVGFRCVISL